MVNNNKLKLTQLQREILETLFVKVGELLNQRELSKILKVSPPAITKAIKKLIENNLIIFNMDKSNISEISLNFDNNIIVNMKKIFNLNSIYESNLLTFLEKNLPGSTVILFGSYQRGEDTLKSDIDIAIIGIKEKELNLKKFEKILEREISLQFYNSFKDIHKNLKENIFNGVVYSGGIEL